MVGLKVDPFPQMNHQVHDDYAAPGRDAVDDNTAMLAYLSRIRSERTTKVECGDSMTCDGTYTDARQAPPAIPRGT